MRDMNSFKNTNFFFSLFHVLSFLPSFCPQSSSPYFLFTSFPFLLKIAILTVLTTTTATTTSTTFFSIIYRYAGIYFCKRASDNKDAVNNNLAEQKKNQEKNLYYKQN